MSRVDHGHEHEHEDQDQGAEPSWWKALDVLVWVAVAVVVILGTEWLVGLLIREKLAAAATRITKAAVRKPATDTQTD